MQNVRHLTDTSFLFRREIRKKKWEGQEDSVVINKEEQRRKKVDRRDDSKNERNKSS
jgi:hypothetical protein